MLVHRVNADRRLREVSYDNNAASVLLRLRWRAAARSSTSSRPCPASATCGGRRRLRPRGDRRSRRRPGRCCSAHSYIAISGPVMLHPSGVSEYSTRAGTTPAHPPRDEPVALQPAERLGQRLLGDLADLVEHLAVAPGARSRAGRGCRRSTCRPAVASTARVPWIISSSPASAVFACSCPDAVCAPAGAQATRTADRPITASRWCISGARARRAVAVRLLALNPSPRGATLVLLVVLALPAKSTLDRAWSARTGAARGSAASRHADPRRVFGVYVDPWHVDDWARAVGAAPQAVAKFEAFSRRRRSTATPPRAGARASAG